ncbi:MAG: hypothetical protein GX781_01675 [Clostridiales bacterium]|nr:hypothetical protein [Clostridiales bacterium]
MNRTIKDILARLLRFTGKIPNKYKFLYPFWLAATLDVVHEEIYFNTLPDEFDGCVIAFASDPHYGPFLDRSRVIDLGQKLNDMQPDIMILTGDYGTNSVTAAEFFDILPPLTAKHGIFASLGNHDYRGKDEDFGHLIKTMNKSGIHLMSNSAHKIQIDDATLCLCATEDILEGQPDFEPLKQDVSDSDFTIFAPHSPDIIPQAVQEKEFDFDLALCGHTHGGQLVIFGRSLHSSSKYGDRFRQGLMQVEDHQLLVSQGVGTSLLPIRLGTRPQIHRITLKKSKP